MDSAANNVKNEDLPTDYRIVGIRQRQKKTEKTVLPEDYEPSKFSIICGRGRGSYQSDGNVNFRALVKCNLERYSEAPGRLEKSFIVSEVLNMIRESCPIGAFVKYENGRWYDLDDTVCREKVGSLFRDFLHTEYKSSAKAKHAKKVAEKKERKKQVVNNKTNKERKDSNLQATSTHPMPAPAKKQSQAIPSLDKEAEEQQESPKKSEEKPVEASLDADEHPTFYDIDDLSLKKLE